MQTLTMRRLYAVGMLMMVAAMPLKAGGCGGNTACMTMTKADLAMSNGVCPAMEAAQQRIGNSCNGNRVLGPGQLEDGFLCCYPVDQPSNVGPCEFAETGGTGVFQGEVSAGTGCAGGCCTGAGGAGSCFGVDGGSCTTCADFFAGGTSDNLCADAGVAVMDLVSCACSGPCATSCSMSLCTGTGADPACQSCLMASSGGCDGPVGVCQVN